MGELTLSDNVLVNSYLSVHIIFNDFVNFSEKQTLEALLKIASVQY
ncbi:MAG: hypothetical protein AMDU1_APLC00032G0010 [Thermoplasmatales archaeon A-plasma]|jgi:hypothetical protein|nr:MAG: hypothetical protein AMDU1_APLC00032G0010 [Thermoplasmatales archaeon A-plasma]